MSTADTTGRPHHERLHTLKRFLRWLRDYDSEAACRHYLRFGYWSSRIYAVVLILMVALLDFLGYRGISETTLIWITLGWCIGWSHLYFWYQGKEIIAFPVVQPEDANKDLLNSILPVVSIGILVAVWLLAIFLHHMGWMMFDFTYTKFGWIVIVTAALDVFYDLRVNTRVTLNLSKIPGRVDFAAVQPPQR